MLDLQQIVSPKFVSPREQAQTDLYLAFANAAADMQANTEMIAGAAVNILLTVVARMSTDLGSAELRWDDLMGQGKQVLRDQFRKPRGFEAIT